MLCISRWLVACFRRRVILLSLASFVEVICEFGEEFSDQLDI